jgi:hypothetical protein
VPDLFVPQILQGSNCNENTLYLQQLINASLAHGYATGVYASPNSWYFRKG